MLKERGRGNCHFQPPAIDREPCTQENQSKKQENQTKTNRSIKKAGKSNKKTGIHRQETNLKRHEYHTQTNRTANPKETGIEYKPPQGPK